MEHVGDIDKIHFYACLASFVENFQEISTDVD